MRWGYLIPRATIVLAVWMFFTFAFDPIMRRTIVASGQNATGAKIDLERVHTTLFPPSIAIENAQVASADDPWKNLFQFDELRFHLAGRPLLRRSFVVEDASLDGLRWNTPRETSGELPHKPNPQSKSRGNTGKYAKQVGQKAKEIGKHWAADFRERMRTELDPKQLESVRLADTLQTGWAKRFDAYELRVKAIESRLKNIQQTVKKAEGNAFDKFRAYRKAAVESDKLFAETQRIRQGLGQLPQTAGDDFRRIDIARLNDQRMLKRKLDLFKPNAKNLSQTLLGPTLKGRIDDAIEWAHWMKDAVETATAGAPKPERLRGTDVVFPRPKRLPDFLIQRLAVSGVATLRDEEMPFSGTITGITSNPERHGEPIRFNIAGKASSEMSIEGIADYTGETPRHRVSVKMITPTRKEFRLGKDKELGVIATAERTEWNGFVQIDGDRLTGNIRLLQDPVSFRAATVKAEKSNDEVSRVLESALADIRHLEVSVAIGGTPREPTWKLKTDLGEQIAEGVNRAVAREIQAKRRALAKRLDDAVNAKTLALETAMNARFKTLLSQLALQETGAKKLVQRVAGNRTPSMDFNRLLRR